MAALMATTAAITSASATPPVTSEKPAATPKRATGRDVNWSRKMLRPERGTASGRTLSPYVREFASTRCRESPRTVEVSNRAATAWASMRCQGASRRSSAWATSRLSTWRLAGSGVVWARDRSAGPPSEFALMWEGPRPSLALLPLSDIAPQLCSGLVQGLLCGWVESPMSHAYELHVPLAMTVQTQSATMRHA